MFGVALLSSALLALANARIYERCELARDLLSFGVRREHLATWVCIAFHESRFDTTARNPYSGDHGILQISELYWCGAGKACGLPCSALRDEDISDDVECALRIYEEHTRLQGNGFLAWVVYPQHCKHNAKKYLADCESSVKTPLVRTDGRSRVLKPQSRNITTFSKYPKIDELLPPYLTIESVFSENYEKEFEQNYNNKVRIDWLNYKVDNIDELKLPVFNQKFVGMYTTTTSATTRRKTTTTTTTTTTTEPPLPKIKPPSPRRIESNSFRRKKLRPIFDPVKFIETTDSPALSTTTITPTDIHNPTTENVRKHDHLLKSVVEKNVPLTTTTIKPSTKNLQSYSTFAAFTLNATIQKVTTKSPTIYTANPVLTTTTERSSSTTSSKGQTATTTSINRSLLLNQRNSSFSVSKDNSSVTNSTKTASGLSSTTETIATIKNDPFNFYKSYFSSTIPTKTTITTTTTTTTTRRPWSNLWSDWRTTSKYTKTTSTLKPSTTRKTENTSSTIAVQAKETVSIRESKEQSTTPNPWTKSRAWFDFKASTNQPTKLLGPINNTSSTRILVESTTSKPPSTTPIFTSQSTTNPTVFVKSTTSRFTTTKPTSATTSRTTARSSQSIFDLYLNPTKRTTVTPFSLSPFRSSGLSLKIFAGGTTTHAPTISRSYFPKNISEETTKNQKRIQTWRRT